jgi:hypothetical protein
MWIILIPNEHNFLAHTHLAIKERPIASKFLAIHDRQIAIAHFAMKERQIASNFFSKRERQVTSNYLAMLMTFAHLAMKERQIASTFFSEREYQVTTATPYVCLTKQIIQNKNILFMFHHIHGTFKFREYSVYVSSRTCDI